MSHVRWLPVVNADATTIPAFGIMRISGVNADSNVQVMQPNRDGQTDVLFNGPVPIEPGGAGEATRDFPCMAAYTQANEQNANPADGEIWGAVAGSWYLAKSRPGFRTVGTGSNGICNVVPQTESLVTFVQITSTTKVDGRYPAKAQTYDPVTRTWSPVEDVWYVDANE